MAIRDFTQHRADPDLLPLTAELQEKMTEYLASGSVDTALEALGMAVLGLESLKAEMNVTRGYAEHVYAWCLDLETRLIEAGVRFKESKPFLESPGPIS